MNVVFKEFVKVVSFDFDQTPISGTLIKAGHLLREYLSALSKTDVFCTTLPTFVIIKLYYR